jgi:hypothetical protein
MASPNAKRLWILTGVTYGLVLATTILAVWAYYYLAAKTQEDRAKPSVQRQQAK